MEHKKSIENWTAVYFCLHHEYKKNTNLWAFLLLCGLVSNIFTMFFRYSELCLERCDSYGDFCYLIKNLTFLFKEKETPGLSVVCSKVVFFMFRKGFLKIFFYKYLSFWCYFPGLVSDLPISKFFINTKNEDDLTSISHLLRLYIYKPCEPKPNEARLCD